ncbi:MAG: PKD domain-containing protein [Chitinophagaceae bacterium]
MNRKASSFFRVDEQVFFTMGGLCVLALLIMAFRFTTHTPCTPVKIVVNSTELIENRVIRFKAETVTGLKFSWDFGDGTVKDEETAITNHQYKKTGKYTVSVMVNGDCSDMLNIFVDEAPMIVNKDFQPMIMHSVNDTAYLNEPVSFSDACTASTKWEWNFGETDGINATEREVSYPFRFTGKKIIKLKINNREDMVTYYQLYVIDKVAEKNRLEKEKQKNEAQRRVPVIRPELEKYPSAEPLAAPEEPKKEPEKVKPKIAKAGAEQLASMLDEVADGKKRAEDFSEYLCGQLGISVLFDGDVMPFSQMCEKLKRTRRIKRISVVPTYNENNCIVTMTVALKKRLI